MSHETQFQIRPSARTVAPGGQIALQVEGPEGDDYTFVWHAESGKLYQPPAKGGGKKTAAAGQKAFTASGPVADRRLHWEAGDDLGRNRITVDVLLAGKPLESVATRVEVTEQPVSETLIDSIERGLTAFATDGRGNGGQGTITLERSKSDPTANQPLWVAIRNRTAALGFKEYQDFVDHVLCQGYDDDGADCDAHGAVSARLSEARNRLGNDICHGVDAYELLKATTEAFLILHCGIGIDGDFFDPADEDRRLQGPQPPTLAGIRQRLRDYLGTERRLPYLTRIIDQNFSDEGPAAGKFCTGLLDGRIDCPCMIELIWSYWMEEGSLVQTLNAISMRFQNKRGAGRGRDPLAALALDPLRPLSNLLWGYVQDERDRLSVARRAYEYDHHYGLKLVGRAVPKLRSADSRSKFLEAFHSLLHQAAVFYQEDADTTVFADGFPLLNALREVHVLLAEGAHNQYGDLPWTARVEMLMQQWMLARPETRDFLRGRYMVPYSEPWMGQVDTMKKLQRWNDTSVTHFRNLAVDGEQVLLSIRFDDWIDVNDADHARNWARYWRPEVQRYIHAYRAVTGADLSAGDSRRARVDATQPSVHLQRRLAAQRGA